MAASPRVALRVGWRAPQLLLHLLIGLLLAVLAGLDYFEKLDRGRLAGWWHRRVLRILAVRVHRQGGPAAGAHLSVANHVSWLDIPVLGAIEPLRFVAKSEIRHWPLAGWLASAAGSFYLRRGKGDTPRLLERLGVWLRSGGVIGLFPEGTTTDGTALLRFHARLFAPAIEARCPVQPVALRYRPDAEGRSIAPFVGDDDLLRHVLRVLCAPRLDVEVIYGAPIDSRAGERTELASRAHAAIAQALGLPAAPAELPLPMPAAA